MLFKNIIDFFLLPVPSNGGIPIVLAIATLMIVWAGAMFMLAYAGNPSMIGKAKSLLQNILIGLIIVYGAWVFVGFLLSFSGFIKGQFFVGNDPKNWFIIPCP